MLEPWLARHAIKFRDNNLARLPSIREAVDARDFGTIKVFGHNLRGMGATYGMAEVTRLGLRLEVDAPAERCAELVVALDELEAWLTGVEIVAS